MPARDDRRPATPRQAEAGELRVFVRLTPRGGRDAIDGIEERADGRRFVRARVRAAAHEGAANAALAALFADALGVAPGRVRLVSGAAAREKILRIEGDPIVLSNRLATSTGRDAA